MRDARKDLVLRLRPAAGTTSGAHRRLRMALEADGGSTPRPVTISLDEVPQEADRGSASALAPWRVTVAASHDPCLLLDTEARIVGASVAATEILGCADVPFLGHALLDVVELAPFAAGAGDPEYAGTIAPLAVLRTPTLGRSLLRVRHRDGAQLSIDVVAAPLHDADGSVAGALVMLAPLAGPRP